MKTTWLFFLATIATALIPSAIYAQDDAVNLTDPTILAYSRHADEAAYPSLVSFGGDTRPRLEVSSALLFLQPGSDSLEYGTRVHPLPAPSPHWENQSIRPNFTPAFELGVRYFVPTTGNDIRSSWTHLDSTDSASFESGPLQFAGPPYLIGPGATNYNLGHGSVNFKYDSINFEAGHLFRAGNAFQVRVFGGLQYASINQDLTGSFSDYAGTIRQSNSTNSEFSGAGPRFGVNGQFNRRYLQIFGDVAAVALVGKQQSQMNFNTTSAMFPDGNPQSFSSPNATQIVPGLDTRLGTSYSFPFGRGILKIEAGYQAMIYMGAINSYSLTQVATPPVVGGVGVFFATAEHLQNNFTAHGPYMSTSWEF